MEKIIFVQLLDEGTMVYRSVPAIELGAGVFRIMEGVAYNPEDETWEFPPGTQVLVEEKNLTGENVLVAIAQNGILKR